MKAIVSMVALLMLAALIFSDTLAQRVFKDCPECPEMVVLPAGSFTMGGGQFSNRTKAQESPQHLVRVHSFAIGKYEVTQEQWFALMGDNPSSNKNRALPVESVSWNDVQQFIAKLNQKTGQHYRLPSEAEWEYAARAGTDTDWSFGDDESKLGNYAWYTGNSLGKSQVVGRKMPNNYDLYDMHGNVWEWVQDCWHDNYAKAPIDGSAWMNDCSGDYRVLRGGSWYFFPEDSRSAARNRFEPFNLYMGIGFRVARSL